MRGAGPRPAVRLRRRSRTPAQRHSVALVVKSTQTEFWLLRLCRGGGRRRGVQSGADHRRAGDGGGLRDPEPDDRRGGGGRGGGHGVFRHRLRKKTPPPWTPPPRPGVQIVSIDSGVDSDQVSTYIGTDNYAAGQMAAQAALERVYGPLYVGVVNYDVGTANGQERERGRPDALAESGRAEITAVVNTLAEAGRAQADTAALLTDHPEINVLLAFNEPTSVGAAQAVEELGLSEEVFLVGFDSNVVTVDGLQDGCVDALVVQNPYAMGYLGVESAYQLLTGQGGALDETVDTSTQIVDRSNLFTLDSQKALFAFEEHLIRHFHKNDENFLHIICPG